jgi:outer membrane protein TolC
MQLRQNDLNRMVEISVEKALMDRQAADSSLAAAKEGLAAATEARTLYETNFRQGSGALSDILSAEENQRFAELALVAAQLERTRAAANLALVRGQNLIALSEEP